MLAQDEEARAVLLAAFKNTVLRALRMMEEHEIARLVRERRKECGIGLCGSIDALVSWLSRTHNILTDQKTVERWLKQPPSC